MREENFRRVYGVLSVVSGAAAFMSIFKQIKLSNY